MNNTERMIGYVLALSLAATVADSFEREVPRRPRPDSVVQEDFVWVLEPLTGPSEHRDHEPTVTIGLDGGLRVEVAPGVTIDPMTGGLDYGFGGW